MRSGEKKTRMAAAVKGSPAGHDSREAHSLDEVAVGENSEDLGESLAPYLVGSCIEPAGLLVSEELDPPLRRLCSDWPSLAAMLAATTAAAGHLELDDTIGCPSAAMRVATLGDDRRFPKTLEPLQRAVYAFDAAEVLRWRKEKSRADLGNMWQKTRCRLERQLFATAATLGRRLELPEDPEAAPAPDLPRPRFFVRNPALRDLKRACEAAPAGVLVLDEARAPWMSGFGTTYASGLPEFLNSAAAGFDMELGDPRLENACMRPVVVSVVGALSVVALHHLHKLGLGALRAVVFASGVDLRATRSSDPAALTETLTSIRRLAEDARRTGTPLRASATARQTAEAASEKFVRDGAAAPAPLTLYHASTEDLLWRIAISLHLIHLAERKAPSLKEEVDEETMRGAVAIMDKWVLPGARAALAAASAETEIRCGRRILSFVQRNCGSQDLNCKRRDLVRRFRRSIEVQDLDRALDRLIEVGLLIPSGDKIYRAPAGVLAPEYRLPDLVTDPRRPN